MKLKKVLIVLLMPAVAQIIIACCECGDSVSKNYSHLSMTIAHVDNAGEKPVVTTSPTVPKNAYGIKVQLQREIVACNKSALPTFFQSAYACSCPPPLTILAKDTITDFRIFSVYDFDTNHSSNSDVSEFFKVYNYGSYTSITGYLGSGNSMGSYYGDSFWTLHNESELELEITLLLMTAPKINSTNKFRVQITLSDGRIIEHETTEIDFI